MTTHYFCALLFRSIDLEKKDFLQSSYHSVCFKITSILTKNGKLLNNTVINLFFSFRSLRDLTLSTLCSHGNTECVNKSKKLFNDWSKVNGQEKIVLVRMFL